MRYSPEDRSRVLTFTLGSGTDGIPYVSDADGYPNVFYLNAIGAELKLNGNNAHPENRWDAESRFVFRIS